MRFGKETKLYLEEEKAYRYFFCIGKNSDGQGMLLPKNCVDKGQYRMDWKANDANSYGSSDAKKKADLFGEKMKQCVFRDEKSDTPTVLSAAKDDETELPNEWMKPQHPNRKKWYRKKKK